jgi:hypothetical protein
VLYFVVGCNFRNFFFALVTVSCENIRSIVKSQNVFLLAGDHKNKSLNYGGDNFFSYLW